MDFKTLDTKMYMCKVSNTSDINYILIDQREISHAKKKHDLSPFDQLKYNLRLMYYLLYTYTFLYLRF
jgi:hypothetical protein